MAQNAEKKGISRKREPVKTKTKKPAGTKKSDFSFDFKSLTFIHSKIDRYITPTQKRNSKINMISNIIPLHV